MHISVINPPHRKPLSGGGGVYHIGSMRITLIIISEGDYFQGKFSLKKVHVRKIPFIGCGAVKQLLRRLPLQTEMMDTDRDFSGSSAMSRSEVFCALLTKSYEEISPPFTGFLQP